MPLILTNVQRGSVVNTDEHSAYKTLSEPAVPSVAVNHSPRSMLLASTVTGSKAWGHLTKGIRGTNVQVSKKHMWKYVSEFTYRYNHRELGIGLSIRLVWGFQQPR